MDGHPASSLNPFAQQSHWQALLRQSLQLPHLGPSMAALPSPPPSNMLNSFLPFRFGDMSIGFGNIPNLEAYPQNLVNGSQALPSLSSTIVDAPTMQPDRTEALLSDPGSFLRKSLSPSNPFPTPAHSLMNPTFPMSHPVSSEVRPRKRRKASLPASAVANATPASTVQPALRHPESETSVASSSPSPPREGLPTQLAPAPGRPLPHKDTLFVLLEQPRPEQRKCYQKENRNIIPNPLVLVPRYIKNQEHDQRPTVIETQASVKLVDINGNDLNDESEKFLESTLCTELPESANTAKFALKLLGGLGRSFRLLFNVRYRLDDGEDGRDVILSDAFTVTAKKRADQLHPDLMALKPTQGRCNEETEVWIKGANFSANIAVSFGDQWGTVVETSENLLSVLVPPRKVDRETTVSVVVCNVYGTKDYWTGSKKLTYTYLP